MGSSIDLTLVEIPRKYVIKNNDIDYNYAKWIKTLQQKNKNTHT